MEERRSDSPEPSCVPTKSDEAQEDNARGGGGSTGVRSVSYRVQRSLTAA